MLTKLYYIQIRFSIFLSKIFCFLTIFTLVQVNCVTQSLARLMKCAKIRKTKGDQTMNKVAIIVIVIAVAVITIVLVTNIPFTVRFPLRRQSS